MKRVIYWLLVSLCYPIVAMTQTYETGVITTDQPNGTTWFTVALQNSYTQPIVIAGPVTEFGSDPVHVRVRNVTATSFEYQLEEFEVSSPDHTEETFSYLVIEQGQHNVGGTIWEAGIANGNTDATFLSVPLNGGFSTSPIIFTQLASNQDPVAAIVRVRNVTNSSFEIRLDEQEANTGTDRERTATDNVHYLAVQPSIGTIGSGANASAYSAQTPPSLIDHNSLPLSFTTTFSPPVLLAGTQTMNGNNPFFLRYSELDANGVELRIAEETSADLETIHNSPETISYLVLAGGESDKRLLWVEDFAGLSDGTTDDSELTAWSTERSNLGTAGSTFFGVQSNELAAQQTIGKVAWQSEQIPITGYDDVKIAVDIRSAGSLNPDDSIQIYYRVDSGPEVPLLNGLQIESFDATTAMIGGLSGDQVQVIVRIINSGGSEIYYVDNVRVYTETDNRYAIQNGNWSEITNWSYTAGGASCSCIPDLLSNTHIDGYTVDLNTDGRAHSLTVYSGGRLQWVTNSINLALYGDATLDVQSGGVVDNGSFAGSDLRFAQWNSRNPDGDLDRVGESYPGVNATISVDEPDGLNVWELAINAQGTVTIQGVGSINVKEDLDINFVTNVTNNLAGNLAVAVDLRLSYPGIVFTNHGSITIGNAVKYERENHHLINEGSLEAIVLEVDSPGTTDNQLTNRGTLTVVNEMDFNNSDEFQVDNYGTIDTKGNILNVQGADDVQLHNYDDALWYFGQDVDPDVKLFANYAGNTIHYNGIVDQTLVDPQDAYWNLALSNRNTSGSTESLKTPSATNVDINGNLTMIGTATGETSFRVGDANADVTIGGDWWQDESGPYAQFEAGNRTVTFDGDSDQEIITSELFHNLTIDKTNGKVTATEGASVENEARLINGIVEAPIGSRILFENSSSVSSASNISHVQGSVTKQGGTDFTFPVGDGTHYRPIGITSFSSASDIAVDYRNAAPPDASLKPDSMVSLGNCGYWEVNSSIAPVTADVTLYWDADCPVDFNEVVIAHWNGTAWEEVPGTPTGNGTAGSITTDAVRSDFGLFALAEVSDIPVATDDILSVTEDIAETVAVIPNDSDMNGLNASSVTIVADGANGTASVDTTTGEITYLPDENFNGADSLVYTVQDAKGLTSNQAVVRITVAPVNDAPVAQDDEASTNFQTTLTGGSVLANDSDPVEGDDLTAHLITDPTDGALDFQPDGTYTYQPKIDFEGIDTFTYRVCDSGTPPACDTAMVAITVLPFNFPPQTQDDFFSTNEDTEVTGNLLTNDLDPNDNALTVAVAPVQAPAHGTVVLTANGTFTYTPEDNFHGTDELLYQVCDNGSPVLCDTARLTIEVTPINDAPVAVDDAFGISEGNLAIGNVLDNDEDPDGDDLTVAALVTNPTAGTATVNPDGSFTYVPSEFFTGEDQFTYQVCDDQNPNLCAEATVAIAITASEVLQIPKGFSPNGDGTNDGWAIEGIRAFPNNQVKIFNRWGNVVYDASGYDNIATVWRGEATKGVRLGGTRLPSGTYFYIIDLGSNQQPISGYIVLKR
ncbi:MAG: Ig-like domain-containing protein [Bacteroidota bacterium]